MCVCVCVCKVIFSAPACRISAGPRSRMWLRHISFGPAPAWLRTCHPGVHVCPFWCLERMAGWICSGWASGVSIVKKKKVTIPVYDTIKVGQVTPPTPIPKPLPSKKASPKLTVRWDLRAEYKSSGNCLPAGGLPSVYHSNATPRGWRPRVLMPLARKLISLNGPWWGRCLITDLMSGVSHWLASEGPTASLTKDVGLRAIESSDSYTWDEAMRQRQ